MIQVQKRWNCPGIFLFFFLLAVTITLFMLNVSELMSQGLNQADIQYIREQAARGDPEAQFSLALLLDHGDMVALDKQEAVSWFIRAAEQNFAGACLYLGIKYEYGNTVKQDIKKAAYWYRKAAMQGWSSAQYFLGMLYISGEDMPANKIEAYTWLSIAAENNYPDAEEEKNNILSLLSEKEKEEAEKMTEERANAILHGGYNK